MQDFVSEDHAAQVIKTFVLKTGVQEDEAHRLLTRGKWVLQVTFNAFERANQV